MEGRGNGVLATLVILAALTASGSSSQILEGPQNATVLQGSEARFNCTVSPGWKLIMWALKGTVVLSVTVQQPIITSNRFTSASYNLDGNLVSEMIVHDVQLSDAGLVRCSLQNSDLAGSAFLEVQVVGTLHILSDSLVVTEDKPCNVTCQASGWIPSPDITWEVGVPVSHSSSSSSFLEPGDTPRAVSVLALTPQGNGTLTCVAELRTLQASRSVTVNLTVVQPPPDHVDEPSTSLPTWALVLLAVSFSLLLILIIVLIIIFCCCCVSGKEKKESSYQDEISSRKSADVKTNTRALDTKPKSGSDNYGYRSDEARGAGYITLFPKSSELSVPAQQSNSHPQQEPEKQRPAPGSRPQVSFNLASPQKVRNVTVV